MNLITILLVLSLQLGIVLASPFEPSDFGIRNVSQEGYGNECDIFKESYVHGAPSPWQSLYKGLVRWVAERKTARTVDANTKSKRPLETPVADWAEMCKKINLHDGIQSEHMSMIDHAEACHRQALEIISSPKGVFTEEMASGHTDLVVNPRVMAKLIVETMNSTLSTLEDEFGDDEEDDMAWPGHGYPRYMWYFKPKEGKRYSIRSPEQTIEELEKEMAELEQRILAKKLKEDGGLGGRYLEFTAQEQLAQLSNID
ncbi:Ff.00g097550.m01.CDS01 [Fusarium sp. VM40]|nr:Ff.00g097550.m01.CDS01 [Fusarium sp. VM40]